MKNFQILICSILVLALLPVASLGSNISVNDYRLELPGNWQSHVENDGVSSIIEKEQAGGFYKTFTLSISDKVSDSEFLKSKADFAQHFNAIESNDETLKLLKKDLTFNNKNGIQFHYFVLFGVDHNVLTFYALTSHKERVMLISYRIYKATENLPLWEKEFTTVLDSLM